MLTYNVNNNFLALTSTFVKKSFEVGNISVSPFWTKLSRCTSFFLNAPVLFLSAKIIVQNPCRDLLSLFKWRNISAWYDSLLIHISSKINSANGEFLFIKISFVLVFLRWAQQGAKELILLTAILVPYGDAHAANPYFHTMFWSLELAPTSNFINSFGHVIYCSTFFFKSVGS